MHTTVRVSKGERWEQLYALSPGTTPTSSDYCCGALRQPEARSHGLWRLDRPKRRLHRTQGSRLTRGGAAGPASKYRPAAWARAARTNLSATHRRAGRPCLLLRRVESGVRPAHGRGLGQWQGPLLHSERHAWAVGFGRLRIPLFFRACLDRVSTRTLAVGGPRTHEVRLTV